MGIWPTLLAFIAMLVLYHAWISPLMFQRAWIRHSGIRPGDLRRGDKRSVFVVSIFGRAFMAVLLGMVAGHAAAHPAALFTVAALVWLAVMFEQLAGILSRREPLALFFLLTFRHLACIMLGALIYYLWSML
ncbi:MAG: hypothetical protein DI582_07470 [Azospirillum brasilense]|nr:MAG: hypothetical protein DI582_07470 [Azospirillum brasilense]